MFVLANGAYKSGSTWLLAILCELKKFDEIPAPYRRQVHQQVWVEPAKLGEFLESGCYREHDYLSKGHYPDQKTRDLVLSYDGVIVFDITRNLPDTIVSHYYHFSRIYGVDWSFQKYYWLVGRYKAFGIRQYHETWGIQAPNVYVSSFERLKRDFGSEVRRIAQALGQEIDDAEIDRVKQATSLSTMRTQRRPGAERFFRKGEIGEWQQHFGERELADIERIEKYGLPPVERGIYALLFDFRNSVRSRLQAIKGLRMGRRSPAPEVSEAG